MLRRSHGRWGDISFYLGGKSAQRDDEKWKPNIAAVKATIGFAVRTKRLEQAIEEV